jgi:hypothetical protein
MSKTEKNFKQFRAEISAELVRNLELHEEYGGEFYEGRIAAYRVVLSMLDRGGVLSVRKEDELYEKGYNDALKDVEELLLRKKSEAMKKE